MMNIDISLTPYEQRQPRLSLGNISYLMIPIPHLTAPTTRPTSRLTLWRSVPLAFHTRQTIENESTGTQRPAEEEKRKKS
jgi:hypothetical protein